MYDLRDELRQLQFEFDLTQKAYLSRAEAKQCREYLKEKNELPDGVERDEAGEFFRYVDTDLSKEEIAQLFICRQTSYLRSIKNSMTFFVILSMISIALSLFAVLR